MKLDDLLKPRKQTLKPPKYNWVGSGVQLTLQPDRRKTFRALPLYYGIPTAVVQSGTGEDTIGAGAGVTGVSESEDILAHGKTAAERITSAFKPPRYFKIDDITWALLEEHDPKNLIWKFEIHRILGEDDEQGQIIIKMLNEYTCTVNIEVGEASTSTTVSVSNPITWEVMHNRIMHDISKRIWGE